MCVDKLQAELDALLSKYKLKCCKTSKIGCCMNLIPVWSESDLKRMEEIKSLLAKK